MSIVTKDCRKVLYIQLRYTFYWYSVAFILNTLKLHHVLMGEKLRRALISTWSGKQFVAWLPWYCNSGKFSCSTETQKLPNCMRTIFAHFLCIPASERIHQPQTTVSYIIIILSQWTFDQKQHMVFLAKLHNSSKHISTQKKTILFRSHLSS